MEDYSDKYTKNVIIGVGVTFLIILIIFGVWMIVASQYNFYPFDIYHPEPDTTSGLYVKDKNVYNEKLTEEGKQKKEDMIARALTSESTNYRGTLNGKFNNPFKY